MAPTKKRSPFMEFAMEWRSKDMKRKSLPMSKQLELAGKVWERMTDMEKLIYKESSKTKGPLFNKDKGETNRVEKLASSEFTISEAIKKERHVGITERIIKKKIQEIVKCSRMNNNFKEQKYYFVMANYFVKTEITNCYFPAEIALAEFSLEQGVINKYHSFINPGNILFGKVYQAQVHSAETHRLPLPPDAKGERDLGKLYVEILKFISPEIEGHDFKPPPLFTTDEYVPIIPKIMSFLYEHCIGKDVPEIIQILPIQYLFYTLKIHSAEIGENEPPKSIYITNKILESDKYDYLDGITCDFHEQIDRGKYCALSCCIRWAYIFAENLCLDVAIDLKPGYHVPLNKCSLN